MSVIQNIRDKYARWAVIAIAVSLLGFILMDAFAGRTGLFGGSSSSTIGKINGTSIDYKDFNLKVADYEKRSGTQGDYKTIQAVQEVWNQQVADVLLDEQYDDLGMNVSDKELKDILFGANPPQDIKQQFTDPNTGVFNAVQAQQAVSQVMKSGTPDQQAQMRDYLNAMEKNRLMEKFNSLILNTTYAPKWFIEKRNIDNGLLAKVSYVSVPYTSISDSAVKVSDSEIEDYIKDHKKQFEQKEETRSVNYVLFSGAPSAKDSATAKDSILALKLQLDTAKDYESLTRKSTGFFYNSYISKDYLTKQWAQNPAKDSILSAPAGTIYGPYIDNGVYEITKIIDKKIIPDTVKVRHILIATQQRNQAGDWTPVRPDSTAKRIIDSVQKLLNEGQKFDSLVVKFSEDPGSKNRGGVYDSVIANGNWATAFNDFIFLHKTGERGIVKTEFGYHLVEILNQKGSTQGYKIALLTKPIIASQETDNQASNDANNFAASCADVKTFNDAWEKTLKAKGVNKLVANDIKPMDFTVTGVQGNARTFIKKLIEANVGDVVGPEDINAGDYRNYIVGVVTEINKEGLPSVNKVRAIVEPVLRNKKKAEQIKKNIGTVTDLNQLAQKLNLKVQSADSVQFTGGRILSYEPKVIGAAFNSANKNKVSEPIAGNAGVYIIRTDNVFTKPVETANIQEQRQFLEIQSAQQFQQAYRSPADLLQKAAKIKDYRYKFY